MGYFGALDDYVYALNTKTGALIWKFLTHDQINDNESALQSIYPTIL